MQTTFSILIQQQTPDVIPGLSEAGTCNVTECLHVSSSTSHVDANWPFTGQASASSSDSWIQNFSMSKDVLPVTFQGV